MSGPKGGSPISIALILAITAAGMLSGLIMGEYWMYVLAIGLAQSVFGLSIGVVYGQAGMLSVAQVSIGAIGAWSVAALSGNGGPLPLPWSLFVGAGLSVIFGLICALPALRLRQINLAIVTLGVVLAVYTVAKAGHVPGSSLALYVAPPDWGRGYQGLYWLAWLSFGGLALITVLIRRSRMGLSWLAISRSERAAAAVGVSVIRAKLTAFGVAAALAGWAGGLLVVAFGSADPANFEPVQVLTLFVLAVMMGAGLWEGALALGLFNAVSSALLRAWDLSPDVGAILFAVGAVQILAMESGGFSYDLRRLFRWFGRRLGLGAAAVASTGLRRIDRSLPKGAPPVAPDAAPALSLDNVTVRYGRVVALSGVSFDVPRGRIVGLVGPNGAGKSTLVDCVTGFVARYDGEVRIAGQSVGGLPAHRRATMARRTFQTERTIAELSPHDFLRLAAAEGTTEADLEAVMAFIGCPPGHPDLSRLDVRLRRLVTIGACLIGKPDVVLIDEPAAGLTTEESEDLSVRIREIPSRFNCGVLLIEHDMELVRNVCDSLVVLDFGHMIAQGPTASVLADPRVMAAYLGEEPDDPMEGGQGQWAAN